MKKVINSKELREKLKIAINLLCDNVKITLGPVGDNVIIDHSLLKPFITNDGVTIAENIESDDVVINTILELAKEASIKTNELVGDGTTTTLVLLQSIFNNGMEFIEKELIKPINLKKELYESLIKIEKEIKREKIKINKNNIKNLISLAANDRAIGNIICDAYLKVKDSKSIKIIEHSDNLIKVEYLKGYTFETNLASNYYFIDNKNILIENAKILLFNGYIDSIENIACLINELNNDLIIIAKEYNEYFINDIINLNTQHNKKIYLLKSIYYGNYEQIFFEDIKDISNAKIINNFDNINLDILGQIKSGSMNEDITTFDFEINDRIKNKINYLEKNRNDFNNKRLAMLKKRIINIYVGAKTDTERKELKMRFDDALCALNSISNGLLPGSGLILLKIANNIKEENISNKIFKEALKEPFNIILKNAGLNNKKIEEKIINNNYQIVYNINKEVFENIDKTEVIDSVNVVINSLSNAVSIASMLLTTNCLIINENINNNQNEHIYNNL